MTFKTLSTNSLPHYPSVRPIQQHEILITMPHCLRAQLMAGSESLKIRLWERFQTLESPTRKKFMIASTTTRKWTTVGETSLCHQLSQIKSNQVQYLNSLLDPSNLPTDLEWLRSEPKKAPCHLWTECPRMVMVGSKRNCIVACSPFSSVGPSAPAPVWNCPHMAGLWYPWYT